MFIGGSTSIVKDDTKSKTPILGDIPIIGSLFTYQTRGNVQREIYMELEAKIIWQNLLLGKKFVEQLSDLLEGEINLIEAITILKRVFKGKYKEKIQKLKLQLEKGKDLDVAFWIYQKTRSFYPLLKQVKNWGFKGLYETFERKISIHFTNKIWNNIYNNLSGSCNKYSYNNFKCLINGCCS